MRPYRASTGRGAQRAPTDTVTLLNVTPQQTIAGFLVGRFRTAIRRGELGVDDPLISSGIIDSFGVLEVIAFLEDTFHVVIDPTRHEVTEFETVNRIAALVESARRTA